MLASYKQINQSLISEGIEPNDLSQIPQSYSEGEFDGKIGIDARFPEDSDYYEGWAFGHREYLCKQKRITLPDEF